MNYIIYYCIVTVICGGCPQSVISDEFGRKNNSNSNTFLAVACCKTTYEDVFKTFNDKDSAYAFYNKAKLANGIEKVAIFKKDK